MMRQSEKRQGRMPPSEEEDDDHSYFTYRPLSNLPTPPPSSRESSSTLDYDVHEGDPELFKFRGPAIHLVNLIPSSASLADASVPLVQALLARCQLPLETVALAVCILDALDARFARHWRVSCPLATPKQSKRHTLPPSPHTAQLLHIDSVAPEVIILSALVVAAKFTEDPQESTGYYVDRWGRGQWTAAQLNATERCIMESLNYRIMPLTEDACIADAMVDMQLAGRQRSQGWDPRQLTPPESCSEDEEEEDVAPVAATVFVPAHSRAKTMVTVGVTAFDFDASDVTTPLA
ncbi:uncharacterized protein F5Z01DRAFT_154683 [Emericellopsis atlantica]|uniref:Cyclin N-terminal domain-containing protein n=1 Tax=Emericellopsis atlantica TaxID=2614577 RepID=A0A9P7ZJD2_9HYPO|nr:uncharacterized protein F5Z01DRAFT_154683 [Emericellopsis atlantica]KAG9253164.1 hypothetical protein F5Z01DRAFT_154683 [Emericellopsis atlantica]